MKLLWTALAAGVLILAPGVAIAHDSRNDATMVVTGTIVISPNGSVVQYALDEPGKLPPAALREMAKAVPRWKFKPVVRDGKAVACKSFMSVRLIAEPIDKGRYAIRVGGAYFAKSRPRPKLVARDADSKQHWRHEPPRYPARLKRQRVSGIVYLVVQIDRDGHVRRVAARQVNLLIKGPDSWMKRWRNALAKASVAAVRSWTYPPPTQSQLGPDGRWNIVTPVSFRLVSCATWTCGKGRVGSDYGQWHAYIPGPIRLIPWANDQTVAVDAASAVPAGGGAYPLHQSLQLLTLPRSNYTGN